MTTGNGGAATGGGGVGLSLVGGGGIGLGGGGAFVGGGGFGFADGGGGGGGGGVGGGAVCGGAGCASGNGPTPHDVRSLVAESSSAKRFLYHPAYSMRPLNFLSSARCTSVRAGSTGRRSACSPGDALGEKHTRAAAAQLRAIIHSPTRRREIGNSLGEILLEFWCTFGHV